MKYHLTVFGCQMNENDADRVRTILNDIGGKEVEEILDADLEILVTCSIRQHAEDRVHGVLNKLQKEKPEMIKAVTGCMVRKTSSKNSEKKDKLLHQNKRIDMVFRIEDAPELAKHLREFFPIPEEYRGKFSGIFDTIPTQKKDYSAFVPISTGCDHHCTYCIVPYTRGKEICRPTKEIIEECKHLIANGAKEITLLGQNVNRYYYGKRRPNPYQTDFAQLLEEVANLDGLKWLRFLSPHPQHLGKDVLQVMAKYENICKHLHLPVQAGDNQILQKMARGYTREQFQKTIKIAREMMPEICLTTDIIVGFCGETEEQFQQSEKLAQEEQFDKIFIAKFSVRPNTPAEKWEDNVSQEEKKKRFHILNDILIESSKKRNQEWIEKEIEVLVDKVNEETGEAEGHAESSKIVQFTVGNKGKRFLGQFVTVKITGAKTFYLKGELK